VTYINDTTHPLRLSIKRNVFHHRQRVVLVPTEMTGKRETASVIRSVYHVVHVALWAVGVAMVTYLLLHLPEMRDGMARAEARRIQEILHENSHYCEKWGMRAGTHEHVICMMDLHDIREKIEREMSDLNSF
jgi:hypothetical protein